MEVHSMVRCSRLLQRSWSSAQHAHAFKAPRSCLSRKLAGRKLPSQRDGMTCAAHAEEERRHAAQKLVSIPAVGLAALALTSMPALASQNGHATVAEASQALAELAELDGKSAGLIARILQPVLSVAILLMIVRIVLSWYPQIDGGKLPWSVAVKPTEPVLAPTRKAIPPVGGVDVSPIVWVAVLSFFNEILLGPQGILNLLQRKIDVL